jgi:hypothetical protein
MKKIEKIEKIELKDLSINGNPCKINFDRHDRMRTDDCMFDCSRGYGANGSIAY